MISLRKSVVPLYRVFSLFSLYAVLFGILGYGAMFVFYLGSSSWVAPFQVNGSDASVLAITSQVIQSQTTLATLRLDQTQTEENLKFSTAEFRAFVTFETRLLDTVETQKKVWDKSAADLIQFDAETQSNIGALAKDVSANTELRASIARDLASGLITKTDAVQAVAGIDNLANTTTGTKISENALVDNIRQHRMEDINGLSVYAEAEQVQFQISQLTSAIDGDKERITSDRSTARIIQQALNTATFSPIYRAVNSPSTVQLAVAPYDGKKIFTVGQPVYECVLGLVVCHNVGKIAAVYPNEQVFENPLSKANTRGYVIELQVKPNAMRSKSLVVGHRPLLF